MAAEESVGNARRFVSQAIADLPGELQDSANLMVSELATNALVHASSGFIVSIDRSDAAVTISVTDRGDGTPAIQSPSSSEPHGRGLRIVEALSDDWGITSTAGTGKTVWFRMSLRSTSVGRQQADTAAATNQVKPGTPDEVDSRAPSRPIQPEVGRMDRPNARNRVFRRRSRKSGRTTTRGRSLVHSAVLAR